MQVYAGHTSILRRLGTDMGGLLPRHSKHWWPLVEDIFTSPAVHEMAQQLLGELVSHEELQSISMDATMRCCLPVMGQVHPRASAEDKEKAVFRGDQAKTRVTCPIICVWRFAYTFKNVLEV